MCKVTAALTHCRCERHTQGLADRLAKDKRVRIRWADKYLWEGDEAERYWQRILSPTDGTGTEASSAAGSAGNASSGAASKYEMREPTP
eukprot:2841664-Lingulodinium_polyedra.AAC.1